MSSRTDGRRAPGSPAVAAVRSSSITPAYVLFLDMKIGNNVTSLSSKTQGLLFGALGVLIFSLTLPATRVAVQDLDGTVVGLGRALVAATLAAVLLVYKQEKLPAKRYLWRLAVVASGVVVGFPLFSALALQ